MLPDLFVRLTLASHLKSLLDWLIASLSMSANLSERSLKQTLLLPDYLQINYSSKFLQIITANVNFPYWLLVVFILDAAMKTGMNAKNLASINTRSGHI